MENPNGSNSKPTMQHPVSHSAASSADSSLDLIAHQKDPPGDIYTKPEQQQQQQQQNQWSMISNSPRGETTGLSFFPEPAFPVNFETNNNAPQMKSPGPSHDLPPGYDPNRIPASIFSSKPTTPEWSTASNESLFSIQMGANSFSTDYAYMMNKSGELNNYKPEERKNPFTPSNPFLAPDVKSNALPPLIDVKGDSVGNNARASGGKGSGGEGLSVNEENVETPKMVTQEKPVNDVKEKTARVIEEPRAATTTSNAPNDRVVHPPAEASRASSPARASSPCHSEASGNSCSSFAFPVLVNDGTKSNSLKGAAATEKLEKPESKPEAEPEKKQPPPPQPQQQQKSESQPQKTEKSWCSCFTCWPRCC